MLTPEEKKQLKNARERARWQKSRNEKLKAKGIDPATRPISENGKRGKAINPCTRDLPDEFKYPKDGESEEEFKRRYQKEVARRYNERHNKRLNEERRKKYNEDHEYHLGIKRKWRAENPEKLKEYDKRYLEKNPQKLLKLAQWRIDNPKRLAQVRKDWYAANPHLNAFYSSKWRRECRRATPSWANWEKIVNIYDNSTAIIKKTGIQHHVDHIVPVQGKMVCGLHIHQNMRIIPAVENVKKRAKLDESLVIALMKLDWDKITN